MFEIELRVFFATTLVCAINNIFVEALHATSGTTWQIIENARVAVGPKLNLDVDVVA